MTTKRGPFKTTTRRPAIRITSTSRRQALTTALTSVTGSRTTATTIIDDALKDFAADAVPEEQDLFAHFVRGYVVPRAMPYTSMSAIERMLAELLI